MANDEKIVYKKYIVNSDDSSDDGDNDHCTRKRRKPLSKQLQKKMKVRGKSEDSDDSDSDADMDDSDDGKEESKINESEEEGDNEDDDQEESDNEDDDQEESDNENAENEEKEPEILFPQTSKVNLIRNKVRRQEMFNKLKQEKRKARLELKKQKKKEEAMFGKSKKKKENKTIESKREYDETILNNEDVDLITEEATDSYADYYSLSYEPKVLITASDRIHGKTIEFIRELGRIIPNSSVFWRKKGTVKQKIEAATKKGYTDMLVINEDQRAPNGLLLVHLKKGPTALFRLSNVKACRNIKRNSRDLLGHRPELILNNFKTRLGRLIARMLGALFHYEPEFRSRSACTFHNQRDYIFFRHHRYEFKFKSNENGEKLLKANKVALRELGPRFTMRLEWLREGVFDGDFEWKLKRKEMEESRTKFQL